MATPPVPDAERRRRKLLMEQLVADGYAPLGAPKTDLPSAAQEGKRRDGVNYARWIRDEEKARAGGKAHFCPDWLGLEVANDDAPIMVVPIPSYSGAYWSDYSTEGWERHEFADEIGEDSHLIDPGIQYPPDWDGPLLRERRSFKVRQGDSVKRWVITGAQDKTPVHGPFMANLEAFAAYLGAEIVIVGSTYNKDWWGNVFGNGRDRRSAPAELRSYASYIESRVHTKRLTLAGIKICAEVNVSPTAERPLSGMLTYGKGASTIFSHPRQELESVPRAPQLDPVLCWTTGYCTPPNYVQRKAGLKAAFHHVIGAVIIEQDIDDTVFVRHIHADPMTGAFQDLDIQVDRGEVKSGQRVRAITYGDVHAEHLDPEIELGTWRAPDCLQAALQPEHVFIHDVLDFFSQNHHNRQDPWHAAEVLRNGLTVAQEIRNVADFLGSIRQDKTQIHVVESNHDLALARWVKENDWRFDLLNAPLQLELALAQANAINAGESISLFETAVKRASDDGLADIHFLREDEDFFVDGVQCGWHGHNGPNGSRGTTQGYLRLASKMNKGHDHTPAKRQGVSSAGTKQRINPMPKWAKGPTTWAHCDVVQYENGRTAHIIFKGGRWKATGQRNTQKKAA